MSRVQELEREIAETRARLNGTIDEIQSRLTVSGLVDEVIGQVGVKQVTGSSDFVAGLLRRNPLPLMVAAAALGFVVHRMNKRPRTPRPLPGQGPYVLTAGDREAARKAVPPSRASHLSADPSV